jgi:hypothetical protein
MTKLAQGSNASAEIWDVELFGLPVEHAYITSVKGAETVPAR